MTESTGPADGNEIILAQFVAELEARGTIVIGEFAERYPDLADQFRDFAAMGRALDHSRPAAVEPLPDKLGEFRIVRRIARGGMGDIFEAYDEHLQRRVAIKTIRHGRISADNRDRFLREQTVLAQLHQTHIVPIHTAGQEGALQYFAMPYIDGAALHHVIAAAHRLDSAKSGSKTPSLAKLAEMVTADSKQRGKAPTPDDAKQQADQSTTSFRAEEPAGNSLTLSPSHSPTLSLSAAYFRSVAEVLADAADALHNAHAAGFVHRDIKPSNLMVDTAGQSWIIDFGLAGLVERGAQGAEREVTVESEAQSAEREADVERGAQSAEREAPGAPLSALRALTQAGALQGTPQYMAPEQHRGEADIRSDVWGLGVTLYELLTLRRAFDESSYDKVAKKISTEQPTPLPEVVRNLPRDLDAIGRKAMQKEPVKRYSTAKEFAEDLRRWLRMEPTRARPAWPLRRVAMWARRNKGWAAAMGVMLVAALLLGIAGILFEQQKADAARELASAAVAREREQRRAVLVEQMTALRLSTRTNGWRHAVWRIVEEVAEIRADDISTNQAAACLIGIDGPRRKLSELKASSVAFDSDGRRLLMGGLDNEQAKIWDGDDGQPVPSGQSGPGPVAFSKNGTPVQLLANNGPSLSLWDVNNRLRLSEYRFDTKQDQPPITSFAQNDLGFALTTMSPDATMMAAAGRTADGKTVVAHWKYGRAKPTFQTPAKDATALALNSKGDFLAVGDKERQVSVWSVPGGEQIATFQATTSTIHCLCFNRDNRLVVGDAGGTVFIWDWKAKIPLICPGSYSDIYAVAFSPDGTILASTGRARTRLWDAATGRLLVELHGGDFLRSLAFSFDASRLAVSSGGPSPGTFVWDLQFDLGIKTLRGLATEVSLVHFSLDGRLLAALSQNWHVGIWDSRTGRLKRMLRPPEGRFADNAGFAFNHDGSRFAFAAGEQARLWDLSSGEEVGSWKLPQGLVDHVVFDAKGRLLLFRVETPDGKPLEAWNGPPRLARVCRIRELHGKHEIRSIAEKGDFNLHVFSALAAPDGSFFVAEGLSGDRDQPNRGVNAYDVSTGKLLWSKKLLYYKEGTPMSLDPIGRRLAFRIDPWSRRSQLVEAVSGNPVRMLEEYPDGLGPPPNSYWVMRNSHPSGQAHGYALFRGEEDKPLVALGIDSSVVALFPQFSQDGRLLAWGNPDGTVTLCDIEEVRRRLNEVGLGW